MGTELGEHPLGGLTGELLDVRGAEPDVLVGGGQERFGERDRLGEAFGDAAADAAARDPMRAEQDDDFRVAVQGGRVASGPAGGPRRPGTSCSFIQGAQHQRRRGVRA